MIRPKQKKRFRKLKSSINITTIDIGIQILKETKSRNKLFSGLIAIGAVAGGLTLNPATLGYISGPGLALKTFSETKDYKRKIEMSKFAYTTYQKVLLNLRTSLRGGSFNKNDFLKGLNIFDDTITDVCSLVTKFKKQYTK